MLTVVMVIMQLLLGTGPVPYSGYDSLSLVAEQVSHHPPGESTIDKHTHCYS